MAKKTANVGVKSTDYRHRGEKRTNIPPAKILEVCFDEWSKSLTRATSHTIASVDRASEIMETRQGRDPVQAYQQIARALKSSKSQVSSSKSQNPDCEHQPNPHPEGNTNDHQKI